jgi:hypothetical protein
MIVVLAFVSEHEPIIEEYWYQNRRNRGYQDYPLVSPGNNLKYDVDFSDSTEKRLGV